MFSFFLKAEAAETVNRITTAQGVLDAFNRIVSFATNLMVVLAVVYFIYNGFKFISAGGDERKIEEAKKQILFSILAVVLIILASSIFKIIAEFIGGSVS